MIPEVTLNRNVCMPMSLIHRVVLQRLSLDLNWNKISKLKLSISHFP